MVAETMPIPDDWVAGIRLPTTVDPDMSKPTPWGHLERDRLVIAGLHVAQCYESKTDITGLPDSAARNCYVETIPETHAWSYAQHGTILCSVLYGGQWSKVFEDVSKCALEVGGVNN